MGLLDDAIREHLDLKRRRGADPEEIERAEREALGPVRRAPDEREQLEPSNGEPAAYDHADEPDWEDELEEYDVPAASEQRVAPQQRVHADEALPAEETLADEHDEDRFGEDEPFGEAEPFEDAPRGEGEVPPDAEEKPRGSGDEHAAATPPPHPAPESPVPPQPRERTSDETVEYDVEDALEQGDKDKDDVLEETPEFLQDTPDHDRLWFEQRPPRDFDFNE